MFISVIDHFFSKRNYHNEHIERVDDENEKEATISQTPRSVEINILNIHFIQNYLDKYCTLYSTRFGTNGTDRQV